MTFTNLLKCSALALCISIALPSTPLIAGNWAQSWQSHAAEQANSTGRIKRVKIKKKHVLSDFRMTTITDSNITASSTLSHEVTYVMNDGTEVTLPMTRTSGPKKLRARYRAKLDESRLKEGRHEVSIPVTASIRQAVIDRGTINTGDSVDIIGFNGTYKASYIVNNGVVSEVSPLSDLELFSADGTSLKEFGVKPKIRLKENGDIDFDASGDFETVNVLFDSTIADIGVKIDERQTTPQDKVSTWTTNLPFVEDNALEGRLYFVTTTLTDEERNIVDRKTTSGIVETADGEAIRVGAVFDKVRLNATKSNQIRAVITTSDDTENEVPSNTAISITSANGKIHIDPSNLKSSTHEYRYVTAPFTLDPSLMSDEKTGFIFDVLDSKGGVFDQIEVNLSVKDKNSNCDALLCGETTHFKYAPQLIKVDSETEKQSLYQLSLALSGEQKPSTVNVRPIAAANERVAQIDMPLAVTYRKDIYKSAKGSAGETERLDLNLRLTDGNITSDVIGGLTDGPVINGPIIFHNGKGTKASASSASGKPQLL